MKVILHVPVCNEHSGHHWWRDGFAVDMNPDDTVHSLKGKIYVAKGLRPERQELSLPPLGWPKTSPVIQLSLSLEEVAAALPEAMDHSLTLRECGVRPKAHILLFLEPGIPGPFREVWDQFKHARVMRQAAVAESEWRALQAEGWNWQVAPELQLQAHVEVEQNDKYRQRIADLERQLEVKEEQVWARDELLQAKDEQLQALQARACWLQEHLTFQEQQGYTFLPQPQAMLLLKHQQVIFQLEEQLQLEIERHGQCQRRLAMLEDQLLQRLQPATVGVWQPDAQDQSCPCQPRVALPDQQRSLHDNWIGQCGQEPEGLVERVGAEEQRAQRCWQIAFELDESLHDQEHLDRTKY